MNHKGKDVNSGSLVNKDERSILGHVQISKGRMNGDNSEIDTARTPKCFDGRLVLQVNQQ